MTRFSRRAAVLVTSVVAIAGIVAGTLAATSRSNDVTVYGLFADANPIIAGDTVRAAGVEVGTVESVTLQGGQAKVAMRLNNSVLPLHDDATLAIQPVNLLGEGYIELNTGNASAPYAPAAAVIPQSRTSRSVSLQDVFNTLNDPTSTALAALLTALGDGVHGQGQNMAATLKALEPALGNVDQLGKLLGSQNTVLKDLIDKAQPVASALDADQGKPMSRLVTSTQQILSAVASNEQDVNRSLAQLPATLTKADTALSSLTTLANSTTPTLRAIRPVTDDLTQISTELENFSKAANPALARLNPVLEKAQALLDQARPVVDQLGPAATSLADDTHNLKPIGEMAVQNISDIMTFVKWWAMSTNGYDGVSNYFRGVAVVTPESLVTAAKGAVPASSQGSPGSGLGSTIGSVLSGLPKLPGIGGGGATDGITGLTGTQEGSMLNQLLGGS